ncbi:MAG TPA: nickel-dependent lactate racemase [Candidatus Deferrimicrobium sp.]|nr:nickel-dependent lactate racemase [Candidatus Deferrimicrobium sp.]
MKIDLSYADGTITLDVPSSIKVDTFRPAAIENPLNFDDFRTSFIEAGGDRFLSSESPLIIVNDGFRTTPTAAILQWLDCISPRVINEASFLVSTGTHAAPTEEDYRTIFGSLWERVRQRVNYHDARDRKSMTLLGKDEFGGEVWLNSAVVTHKRILVIGSVEPHYFAGFTGGRKSIFPGLTDFETIARNHNLANSLQAAPLKLKSNPVAEHLDTLMAMLDSRNFLGIQVVTDSKKQIAGLFVGPLEDVFTKATALAQKVYSHSVPESFDVVLCEVLPPLDGNLYQVQKALENCRLAVRNGGKIVIVAACRQGVGSRHFYDLADQWDKTANRARDGAIHFGSHKLSRVIDIGRRIGVYLYSTLDPEIVRHVFYEPLDNLQSFVYSTAGECEKCNMAVVRDAAHTVLNMSTDTLNFSSRTEVV